MATIYQHFCPVARALEKIGDKWSLLIVRDLLRGPQRFTDLIAYLSNITPKWLTLRLRELEAAGIIQRDRQPGRREVKYQLTPAGRDLAPIVEALTVWGARYTMRPPVQGEAIHPDLLMSGFTSALNRRGKRLTESARWSIRFPKSAYSISFREEKWTQCKKEEPGADVTVTVTPEKWGTLTTVPRHERTRLIQDMDIQGKPERIAEFKQIFGV